MTGPFGRVPAGAREPVVRAAGAAALVLLATILVLGAPLRTPATPLGIVSLQFATSPAAAEAMLTAWEGVARTRLGWAHGLDLVLPVAYAVWVGTFATVLSVRSARAAGPSSLAAGAVLVAAVADQVENVAMAVTLLVGPSWGSVLLTLVAATVKSATLVAALGALAAAVLRARPRQGAGT